MRTGKEEGRYVIPHTALFSTQNGVSDILDHNLQADFVSISIATGICLLEI